MRREEEEEEEEPRSPAGAAAASVSAALSFPDDFCLRRHFRSFLSPPLAFFPRRSRSLLILQVDAEFYGRGGSQVWVKRKG